jgi:hypothetical protein
MRSRLALVAVRSTAALASTVEVHDGRLAVPILGRGPQTTHGGGLFEGDTRGL